MARRKEAEKEKVKVAVMKCGRVKKVVKVWQYYSIIDFCRWFGETREKAEEVAQWCRQKADVGERYSTDIYSIEIKEVEQ